MIREDRIELLVDLAGHTRGNRLLVFARRPAPVQITWLGWPGTTGLTAIDWRISDPYLDSPAAGEQLFSERTMYLPDSFWCYQPPDGAPTVNDLPARDTGVVTFGCLNGIFKVNDPLLDRWGKVLSAVPDSRLLLRAPAGAARQRVLDRFDRFGIDAARVEFVGMLPWPRYWELYHRIDICLDTLPYNGHTTSMDALWMGVPVVTQAGQLPVGRAGVSLLSNLGLTELIGTDSEEYVRIAVGLARDRQRLARLRQELRPRMHRSAIMDAPRFARNLEAAFIQMMS